MPTVEPPEATVEPPEAAVAAGGHTSDATDVGAAVGGRDRQLGGIVGGHRRHRHGVPHRPLGPWRVLRRVGAVAIGLWAIGLVAISTVVYHRAALGEDFATYNQAWTLIGQGHLNPYDTVYGFPFIKADFELIMWPLAMLHLVIPQPVALLWVQDLAVAGTGLVTFVWITEFLERRQVRPGWGAAIASLALVVVIADPGVYGTLKFDFHMEPISTLFLLLAGRDLWSGRNRRAWLWVAVALMCGTFSAIMVVGLGVSALLAGAQTRRAGLLLVATGVAWTMLISALHANQGSGLAQYAYLAGRTTLTSSGGVLLVLGGMITHPWRATDQLASRLGDMYILIKPVGVIGLASAWGFGIPATVILVDALNSRPDFLRDPFQNFAVFPFVLLGTVMVLIWVGQRFTLALVAALAIGAVVTAQALDYGATTSPDIVRGTTGQVAPATGAQLRRALSATPADAQVIATLGVMGRFCARRWCYFFYPDGPRQVMARQVVFVFDTPNESLTTPAGSLNAITYVRDHLRARVLVDGAGVAAFLWTPPPGTASVTIPTSTRP